jgi:fumarylacetoacetase
MGLPNIDETHDPNLTSWVESANEPATDFPIQNLPFAQRAGNGSDFEGEHLCVVIGDRLLDLHVLAGAGLLADGGPPTDWRSILGDDGRAALRRIMRAPPATRSMLRRRLVSLLRAETAVLRDDRPLRERALAPLVRSGVSDAALAFCPGNYTDFYASRHHAANVGSMFRPDNPLLPNYRHVPIGYHGRASSIVPSGTPVRRPCGQQAPPDDKPDAGPSFGPCRMLDYEMELGVFIGRGNELGQPIPMSRVRDHIFGFCLVNDWSARDIQRWEYQPLGPFLAKNFATTISPCIVTMEALEPFRVPGPAREVEDPPPLPYLRSDEPWGLDITVEVWLASKPMRERGLPPVRLSRGNARDLYWTIAQMVVHHASNGCNLQPGDLLASGTISGREPGSRGCLLELTWQGIGPDRRPLPRKPISLPTGETRLFLQDGDEVIMMAYCEREGFRRIGFGECRGVIMPAIE